MCFEVFEIERVVGSVFILSGVVFGGNDETFAFACSSIDNFADINELLLVVHSPVDLVVVTRTKIDHHMFVSEEEHDGDRIVKLVHRVEIWYFRDIHEIDHRKVPHFIDNLVQNLVHFHALRVPVVTKSNDHKTVLLL